MSSNSSALKMILFLGTYRENRVGIRVANFMKKQMEARGYEVLFFDAEKMEFPILKKPVHFYKDSNDLPKDLKTAASQIKDADAYVMVTGEYNHSIPPGLANMLNYFPGSIYSYKPSGIVCYSPGIYGGMRAAIQLRSLTAEIGCLSVSNIFGIPQVHKAIDEEGNPIDDHMEKGAKKMLDQLEWHATAMKNHRAAVGVPK